jgi:hypothetical protein
VEADAGADQSPRPGASPPAQFIAHAGGTCARDAWLGAVRHPGSMWAVDDQARLGFTVWGDSHLNYTVGIALTMEFTLAAGGAR